MLCTTHICFTSPVSVPLILKTSEMILKRHLSTAIRFAMPQDSKMMVRVPLLKAPSHLGHFSSRVNRPYNEDRYFAALLNLPMRNDTGIIDEEQEHGKVFSFAVLDGHGGNQCSDFMSQNLPRYIENVSLDNNTVSKLIEDYSEKFGGYWKRWARNKDSHLESYKKSKLNFKDDLNLRLPIAFLEADYDFTTHEEFSGSTCTSIFLYTLGDDSNKHYWDSETVSQLHVAHIGDSRAIICDRFGAAHPLTSNHHPSSPVESTRLSRFAVEFATDSFGEERFGCVANTRSFGDSFMKNRGVSAEPDILSYVIGSQKAIQKQFPNGDAKTIGNLGGNECFIVLMSDGVTNYATDQEVVDLVMSTVNRRGLARGSPQIAAEDVVKFVETIGGDDNATCMVIKLPGWGEWPITDRTGELREEKIQSALWERRT